MTPLGSGAGGVWGRRCQLFESGFTGFQGFFSVGPWFRWCAQQPGFESGLSGFTGLTITPLV